MTLVEQNIHTGSESLFIGLSSQVDRYQYLLSRCPPFEARLVADESLTIRNIDQYSAQQRKILDIIKKHPVLQEVIQRSNLPELPIPPYTSFKNRNRGETVWDRRARLSQLLHFGIRLCWRREYYIDRSEIPGHKNSWYRPGRKTNRDRSEGREESWPEEH